MSALPDVGAKIRRFLKWIRGKSIRVVGNEIREVQLASFDVWVPAIAGASADFSLSQSTTDEPAFSIELLGIGGGPNWSCEVMQGYGRSKIPTSERIVHEGVGTFDILEVRDEDGRGAASVVARLMGLADVRTWKHSPLSTFDLPDPDGPLAVGYEGGNPIVIDLIGRESASTVPLRHKKNTTWKGSVAVKIDAIGTDLGVGYSAKNGTEISLSYSLPPGNIYHGTLYDGAISYVWTLG